MRPTPGPFPFIISRNEVIDKKMLKQFDRIAVSSAFRDDAPLCMPRLVSIEKRGGVGERAGALYPGLKKTA